MQIPLIIVLTIGLIFAFAIVDSMITGAPPGESVWFALTHFLDGGAMAGDSGRGRRAVAVVVTVAGVLIVSFLTGAFASKLGERIAELRSGRSPIIAKHHILILGFDSKVPLIVRELSRSGQRLSVVVLAQEEKGRMEALLRFATETRGARLRITCRTGDPSSEVSLARCCADAARSIVVARDVRRDHDCGAQKRRGRDRSLSDAGEGERRRVAQSTARCVSPSGQGHSDRRSCRSSRRSALAVR